MKSLLLILAMASFAAAQDVRPKQTHRDWMILMGWGQHWCPQSSRDKWDVYEYLHAMVASGETIVIAHGVKAQPTDSLSFIPNNPPGRYLCYPSKDGPLMRRIP